MLATEALYFVFVRKTRVRAYNPVAAMKNDTLLNSSAAPATIWADDVTKAGDTNATWHIFPGDGLTGEHTSTVAVRVDF